MFRIFPGNMFPNVSPGNMFRIFPGNMFPNVSPEHVTNILFEKFSSGHVPEFFFQKRFLASASETCSSTCSGTGTSSTEHFEKKFSRCRTQFFS
jgi:hypothetical protein